MTDTGHRLELSDATDHMIAAMSDHAAALNSQATAMAASIATPLYGRFDAMAAQLKELATIFTNARQADLNWRTEERDTRDVQSTRLYAELDKLIAASEDNGARLGKLETADTERAHADMDKIARLERIEESQARTEARLDQFGRDALINEIDRRERLRNVAFLKLLMDERPDLAAEAARRAAADRP